MTFRRAHPRAIYSKSSIIQTKLPGGANQLLSKPILMRCHFIKRQLCIRDKIAMSALVQSSRVWKRLTCASSPHPRGRRFTKFGNKVFLTGGQPSGPLWIAILFFYLISPVIREKCDLCLGLLSNPGSGLLFGSLLRFKISE